MSRVVKFQVVKIQRTGEPALASKVIETSDGTYHDVVAAIMSSRFFPPGQYMTLQISRYTDREIAAGVTFTVHDDGSWDLGVIDEDPIPVSLATWPPRPL